MTGRELVARDPRTGARDHVFLAADAAEVQASAARLRTAQPAWAALPMEARCAVLRRFAEALGRRRADLAAALERDTGRRRIAALEVDGVIGAVADWTALAPGLLPQAWATGRTAPHLRHAPRWSPYPLVAAISPWNFPLLLGMIDAVPALLAGCAVLLKPSEVTPRFVEPLRAAMADTPELASVFAVALGDGATGEAAVDVADAVAFTGSVATGRKVALRAAGRLIPAFLELGGKDPLIVLEGSDLEAATDAALRGSVLSTGQACQSIERIYVACPLHDAFVARLVEKARAVRLNWPDVAQGEIGPLIFDRQADVLRAQLDDARARGAQVLTGGEVETLGGGLWLRPTVLTQVDHAMAVMREETFGPLMPVMAFDSVDAAVALADDTDYGLSAAVFGPTLEAAEAVAERLEAGAVSLNDAALTALFHEAGKQAFKSSGLGPSRMGADGLLRFLRRKALIANTSRPDSLAAFREEADPPPARG